MPRLLVFVSQGVFSRRAMLLDATALSYSRFLTFLQCLLCPLQEAAAANEQGHPCETTGELDLSTSTQLELEFLCANYDGLCADAVQFGLRIRRRGLRLRLVHSGSSEPVLVRDLRAVMADIEAFFQRPDRFPYLELVRAVVRQCCEAVRELCPYLDTHKLAAVAVRQGVISGEPFMVPFEVAFETNGASLEIAVPDIAHYTAEHLAQVERSQGRPSRWFHRDMFHWAVLIPCHEVLHIVQSVAGQRDPDPHGWSAEHDASLACLSLVAELARRPAGVVPPGLLEEILLTEFWALRRQVAAWGPAVREAYCAWCAAFGLQAPGDFVSEDPTTSEQFKGMLAFDGLRRETEGLRAQLQVLFRGRSGDVYQCPLSIPDTVAVEPLRVERLRTPAARGLLKQFLSQCEAV